MTSTLKEWAIIERQFLIEEVKWLKVGGKVYSPSGEDITSTKLEQLEARLEHVQLVLEE